MTVGIRGQIVGSECDLRAAERNVCFCQMHCSESLLIVLMKLILQVCSPAWSTQ